MLMLTGTTPGDELIWPSTKVIAVSEDRAELEAKRNEVEAVAEEVRRTAPWWQQAAIMTEFKIGPVPVV